MNLILSPIRGLPGQPETVLSVAGDVLTCDGVAYDLSPVPEGGRGVPDAAGGHPFLGPILRSGGTLCATVRVVLGDDAHPVQPLEGWQVSVSAGGVPLPVRRRDEEASA